MCSRFLQLTVESRDFFSSWEESDYCVKLGKFTKDNFVHLGQFCVSFYESAHLYITVIQYSGWEISHDPTVNWYRLEHM